ncbi:YchJ family metal-binding protein [Oceanimonas pelagia]|uniref:YchJ family metal-binding protein n=1 Tax=Oceanimonas pelagia TaxID=3028314 RepID=A0AA50KLR6_9GAMM|nr:YchJ family metal-binding protein [Oceanimonas pelagia]WMC09357.1 YchJ family metal-binding protein [Oceanimonas pelagia]
MQCHCDSGQRFSDCCQPFLDGRLTAPTPLALMRSRYSAYRLGLGDYLVHTWHPDTLGELNAATLSESGRNTEWLGLAIVFARGGCADSEGEVEFRVRYRENGRVVLLHERSRFVRHEGRWVYHSGQFNPSKIGPNQPCPCHSGKKYKQCCGRR